MFSRVSSYFRLRTCVPLLLANYLNILCVKCCERSLDAVGKVAKRVKVSAAQIVVGLTSFLLQSGARWSSVLELSRVRLSPGRRRSSGTRLADAATESGGSAVAGAALLVLHLDGVSSSAV
ncbi:hypothetical protein NDU88_003338 [Pleurodeles waltl]|uniref:Secreted protein n=1 Tax=Pleurodeles waltl TaxID=8319 RepID=A0AAV7UFV6_PLEWA|nr:hypothetical protein NDU88_003338 [Pleurodeles waltl]